MDDLSLYMVDLKRAQAMNFDLCYLVHTNTMHMDHIVVDAATKIKNYIKYREDREVLILKLIKENESMTMQELFDFIYQHEDLSDPLRMKLARTSYNSHIQKVIKEGKVKVEKVPSAVSSGELDREVLSIIS